MNHDSPSRRLFPRLRHGGLRWFWYALRNRVAPVHPRLLPLAEQALGEANGLEIGGPSRLFGRRGALPVYRWVTHLDNAKFATKTRRESELSDPRRTFDHRRPVTTLDHLRADLAASTPESDTTHFAEVLALHDLCLDPGAGSTEEFADRVGANARTRCIHHHVFDEDLISAALNDTGWVPLAVERFAPLHLGAFAQKEAP